MRTIAGAAIHKVADKFAKAYRMSCVPQVRRSVHNAAKMAAVGFVTGVFLFHTLACFGGLTALDSEALHDAARANLAAYRHSDGGAERALERAAFCAVEGVLRRNDAGAGVLVSDAGKTASETELNIQCAP